LALVRHARARRPLPGELDAERELTPEGREELERQIEGLTRCGFACDRLWSSPWRRARDTAERLAAHCGVRVEPHAGLCSDLDTPEGRALVLEATAAARTTRLVLVGHQPWLAELARSLGAREVLDLECAEVVWLVHGPEGRWSTAARLAPS
jgi:phosphohistidine phosphatase